MSSPFFDKSELERSRLTLPADIKIEFELEGTFGSDKSTHPYSALAYLRVTFPGDSGGVSFPIVAPEFIQKFAAKVWEIAAVKAKVKGSWEVLK